MVNNEVNYRETKLFNFPAWRSVPPMVGKQNLLGGVESSRGGAGLLQVYGIMKQTIRKTKLGSFSHSIPVRAMVTKQNLLGGGRKF